MTLVDTSVWVDHFRRGNAQLRQLLQDGDVATHPYVIGELACGSLPNRATTLYMLGNLPRVAVLSDELVLRAIDQRKLWGKGVGWVDVQLLTAALAAGVPLWTLDKRLGKIHASL